MSALQHQGDQKSFISLAVKETISENLKQIWLVSEIKISIMPVLLVTYITTELPYWKGSTAFLVYNSFSKNSTLHHF